jgi:flagellar basal-body rod protein FlgG
VAINGNGFFQINMPDGTIAYTRDGSFRSMPRPAGHLQRLPVANGITMPANATRCHQQDGVVSVTMPGRPRPAGGQYA